MIEAEVLHRTKNSCSNKQITQGTHGDTGKLNCQLATLCKSLGAAHI